LKLFHELSKINYPVAIALSVPILSALEENLRLGFYLSIFLNPLLNLVYELSSIKSQKLIF